MQNFTINKDKYNKNDLTLIKTVFYRPEHPDLHKPSGWVAKWQIAYKKMFTIKQLFVIEEIFPTEEEANKALRKYNLDKLLPNIKELIQND